MLVNGGVRLDYENAFGGSATPRFGVVFLPRRQSAVKLLYGRAFRAPNSYELYYFDTMREQGLTLSPETISTTELVWEEYIGPHLRTTASVFRSDARHLIAQQTLDHTSGDSLYYTNADRTTARGVDAEIEGALGRVDGSCQLRQCVRDRLDIGRTVVELAAAPWQNRARAATQAARDIAGIRWADYR